MLTSKVFSFLLYTTVLRTCIHLVFKMDSSLVVVN